MSFAPLAALGLMMAASTASAQEEPAPSATTPPVGTPLDLGVLQNKDIKVVQKILYAKEGSTELALHAGWMPFDGYTTTPMGSVSFTKHKSETLGFEGVLSGGYSLKNFTYRQLESDAYGIQPDAYRYLMSFTGGLQWSPIYAKMNWRGKKVLHHDIYGLAGVGGTLEQAMMPDGTMAFSPTLALGAGMRVFLNQKSTLRFQLKDEVIYEKRVKTADTQGLFIKQNVALTVGYGFVGGKK